MFDTIICLEETNSTNLYLKNLVVRDSLAEGTIVSANYQTSGRGQQGNTWKSEKNKNLLFSIILYPDFIEVNRQFLISQIISLAINNVLSTYVDAITVKWPNDIYCRDKKICGILIENNIVDTTITQSIAGIGININQETFDKEIPNPVSLKQISGLNYDKKEILKTIQSEIYNLYQKAKISPQIIINEYKKNLYRSKGYHSFADSNGEFIAKIDDIELTGHIVLLTDSGETKKYAFKKVRFI